MKPAATASNGSRRRRGRDVFIPAPSPYLYYLPELLILAVLRCKTRISELSGSPGPEPVGSTGTSTRTAVDSSMSPPVSSRQLTAVSVLPTSERPVLRSPEDSRKLQE